MHRIVPLIVVALAVALAVAFRVWTSDEPDAATVTPEVVAPRTEPDPAPTQTVVNEPSPPPVAVRPETIPNIADTISIEGVVVEQESRRPLINATVTAYEAKDGFDGRHSAMSAALEHVGELDNDGAFSDAFEIAKEHSGMTRLWAIPEQRRTRLADSETGPDGRFTMQIPRGKQTFLECTAPGFATAYVRIESEQNPDAIQITMHQSGLVRGRVTDARTGEPIPEATVAVSPNRSMATMARAAGRGEFGEERDLESDTDDDGRYELSGVPVGAYRVHVDAQAQGYVIQSRAAPIVNVAAGSDAPDANIQLTRGGFIFGELRDPKGDIVSRASFEVTPTVGAGPFNMFDVNAARAGSWSEVKDDGTFRVGALEYEADYRIEVSNPDYAPITQEIRLRPGRDAGPISIVFTEGSSISGVARYVSGDLAIDTRLMLRGENDSVIDWASGISQTEKTDEAGLFKFERVPDGIFRITAMGSMNSQGGDGTIANVENGHDLTGVEILVEQITDDPTQPVTGTVVDRDGKPVVGIEVTGFQVSGIPGDSSNTDDDGRFSLKLIPALGNSFTLEAKGEAGYKRLSGVRPGTEVRLKLGPSARVAGIVVNEAGYPIADCSVSLEKDSQNFMDAMPFGGREEATTTGDDGRFEIADIKPGAYIVKAESRTQGTGKSKSIQIDEGKTVDGIRVTLEPGARVSGVVYDPDRRPIGNAQVGAVVEVTGPMAAMASYMPEELSASTAAATTNERGEFVIPDVPPGTYTITASYPGFAKAAQPDITLRSGEDLRGVDLMLALGGGASGVYTVNGQPVKDVMIQLIGAGGSKMITTDAEGRFDVTGLPAGQYMAMAIDMNAIDPSDSGAMGLSNMNQRTVEIADGQITDIDFTPPVGVNVSGSVAALGIGENVMVRLRTPDGISFADLDLSDPLSSGLDMIAASAGFGDVEADGSFNIDNVEPGQYVLEVYQQPDPSSVDLSGDFGMESMQAFMPVLVYTQEIAVDSTPIQVTIGAPVP